MPQVATAEPWTGRSIERREDAALLTGSGRYADDLGTRPGTLHAAFLRSPHAHARVRDIDVTAALGLQGVPALRGVLPQVRTAS